MQGPAGGWKGRCQGDEAMRPGGKSPGGAEPPMACRKARSGLREGQEKPRSDEKNVSVPQTDTGRQVENTKAYGVTLVKELGNIAA